MGKNDNATTMTPEELVAHVGTQEATIAALTEKNAALEAALEKAGAQYAKLSKKLEKAEDPKAKKTFGEMKIGKVTYDIVRPKTRFEGVNYTADEIAENVELGGRLLKVGASILREQSK